MKYVDRGATVGLDSVWRAWCNSDGEQEPAFAESLLEMVKKWVTDSAEHAGHRETKAGSQQIQTNSTCLLSIIPMYSHYSYLFL